MVIRKSSGELDRMREAGLLVAETLHDLRRMVEPGISTRELDAYAEKKIRAAGLEIPRSYRPQSGQYMANAASPAPPRWRTTRRAPQRGQ